MLTNEDKLGIAQQHMRNLMYNKYNLELSLIEESAVTRPNEEAINTVNGDLSAINLKIAAIAQEIETLEGGING